MMYVRFVYKYDGLISVFCVCMCVGMHEHVTSVCFVSYYAVMWDVLGQRVLMPFACVNSLSLSVSLGRVSLCHQQTVKR